MSADNSTVSSVKGEIESALNQALRTIAPAVTLSATLERPRQASMGDWACPTALQLARPLKSRPESIATNLLTAVQPLPGFARWVAQAQVVAGFLNLHLNDAALAQSLRSLLQQGEAYGHSQIGAGRAVLVEFVSANPTGPLHTGHGRQAALGDAICNLLASQGYAVQREFYYNDGGEQIEQLTRSVQARCRGIAPGDEGWPPEGYRGDYIAQIAADFLSRKTAQAGDRSVSANGNSDDTENLRAFAVAWLRHEQDLDLQAFGVRFDHFALESSLYADGSVARAVASLQAAGMTYEQEGALWFKSSQCGDDKDRVMRKQSGAWTYFVPDLAYHLGKFARGFALAINIQGSDHAGTVPRLRAALAVCARQQGIALPENYPDSILHKMVTVVKGGEEVRISKRAGSYVTLRDLLDWAGRDAVRFFLVQRAAQTEFTFDVDMARAQNADNPVYSIQYAHARICSIFARHEAETGQWPDIPTLCAALESPSAHSRAARALLLGLMQYPDLLSAAAQSRAPHEVAQYLRELSGLYHAYQDAERILVPEIPQRLPRLALLLGTALVLRSGLKLLGVSAPESM